MDVKQTVQKQGLITIYIAKQPAILGFLDRVASNWILVLFIMCLVQIVFSIMLNVHLLVGVGGESDSLGSYCRHEQNRAVSLEMGFHDFIEWKMGM